MKQHITAEQFTELSVEGRKKYCEWCEKFFRDGSHPIENSIPFTSIGRMLEFLDEHIDCNWEIRLHGDLVDVNYPKGNINPDFEDYKELCDALWDVVKDVLK